MYKAAALLIKISIPPNSLTTLSIALMISDSSLISHLMGKAFPPAYLISSAAE